MTAVLKVDPLLVSFEGLQTVIPVSKTLTHLKRAAELLRQNQVVAFPTETVYGLGASCLNQAAVESIYRAKNRPADNPLIIHVASREMLEEKLLATAMSPKIPPIYDALLEAFWPGPLTILLPLPPNSPIAPACTQGQTSFAVRVPSSPIARALIALSDLPLAAPSANTSSKPSCTTAAHVFEDMNGRIPLILDGGSTKLGLESTVIDGLVSPPVILRPGGISREKIVEIGGTNWKDVRISGQVPSCTIPRAPGMKYRHYAPHAPVILCAPNARDALRAYLSQQTSIVRDGKIALLSFDNLQKALLHDIVPDAQIIEIKLGNDLSSVAHNLFSCLRSADAAGAQIIIVEAVPMEHEGLAIMNRLKKAAQLYISTDHI